MRERHIRGLRLAGSDGPALRDALAQIFVREPIEDSIIVPAVAEPLIVWILAGAAVVEERPIGRQWLALEIGDSFLTTTDSPYEIRWRVEGLEWVASPIHWSRQVASDPATIVASTLKDCSF